MEKVGGMFGSEKLQQKGQQKRAGADDSYGSGNTDSYGSGNNNNDDY
jgi:hypothetical protein